ncbi:MAG TPA: farnesyl diphosphate synthase [Gemmatimonadaceae bacterium]|nr:farnesyl diphosphate synthase [Gemmatimonadaceae bacterium]
MPTPTVDRAEIELSAARAGVEDALRAHCDSYLGVLPPSVGEAVRYSIMGEGKRLRPLLVLAAYHACGGDGDAYALAASVEIVHAYSLVHDDLPCMDNDIVRRGRPTTHRLFGPRVATVAGVAMVPMAARAAADAARSLDLPRASRKAIVRELMRASGAGGMVGGQLLDLEGEDRSLSLAELERVHTAKTGALIAASVRIGGLAAGADARQSLALERYGEAIGLAFQIADDVLDATSTTAALGKTAGRDAALGKSTYPALLGVEGAVSRAARLAEEARAALEACLLLTPELARLASFVVDRKS